MSDIFVSYDSADKERVRALVQVLEGQGWSVWWDRKIPPGKTFAEVIDQAITPAKCILVGLESLLVYSLSAYINATVAAAVCRRRLDSLDRRGLL